MTIDSDGPAYFPGYLLEDFVQLQRDADLSSQDVIRLVRNSFEVSWLDKADRARFLERVDASTRELKVHG